MSLNTEAAAGRRPIAFPLLPLVIAAYAGVAMAVAPDVFPRLLKGYASQMLLLAGILTVALPAAGIILRPRSPVTMIGEILRHGGLRLIGAVLCFCVGMAGFTTLKIAIPKLMPFYADVALAQADAWLHGGDPGLLLHAIIPDWAAAPLQGAYSLVFFSAWFGLLGYVALQRNAELRRRYFWSMAVTIGLLGTVLATALSSVGPILYDQFYPGDRFAALTDAIRNSAAGDGAFKTAAFLMAAYKGGGNLLGSGISAMPSMHLAVVTLNALMLSSINRFVGTAGWLYVAVILIGSVYLGWHYALDGYFSIVAVALIWWAVGKATQRVRRVVR
jgi:hypothetical protein